ncbi:MAG: SDR family oxidoreductase [Verrucomicrobia bacterium]|nr:SDR family oxidoreductase [Verrucomicrobiota bacterium]
MAKYSELGNQIVLVTGGANGIGEAIVRAFHEQDARVCFCDVDVKAGRALAKELGGEIVFQKVDVMKENEVCRWVKQIGARWKRIDVLINNAAKDPRMALEKTSVANWDRLFARNLRAYFLTCREAVRFMPRGGSIINLASITFRNSPVNMSAYVATKGGVIGFTRSVARELGPRRIRVNAVSPGWVMTERQLRQFVTPAIKRFVRKSQSIPDLIQPEEIANVVVFLASDASRAITGQEILVERGWVHG